jgi:hypothetical protein
MKIMVLAAAALVATTLSAAAEHEDGHVGLFGTTNMQRAFVSRHGGAAAAEGATGIIDDTGVEAASEALDGLRMPEVTEGEGSVDDEHCPVTCA